MSRPPATSRRLTLRRQSARSLRFVCPTEIAPILIVARLEEFAYGEATAIAVVLLVISFSMLILINLLESWSKRYAG